MNKTYNKKIKNKKRSGFTLIEVIIFTGVAGIFIVLIFSFLTSFLKSHRRVKKLNQLQDASVYIFNDLTQEAHWSNLAEITDHGDLDELKLTQEQTVKTVIVYRVDPTSKKLLKEITPEGDPTTVEAISPPDIEINRFQIINRAQPNQVACIETELGLEYTKSEPKLISENKTSISLRKAKFKTII